MWLYVCPVLPTAVHGQWKELVCVCVCCVCVCVCCVCVCVCVCGVCVCEYLRSKGGSDGLTSLAMECINLQALRCQPVPTGFVLIVLIFYQFKSQHQLGSFKEVASVSWFYSKLSSPSHISYSRGQGQDNQ